MFFFEQTKQATGLMSKSLSKRVSEKGFHPLHVCEVGVYKPETSIIYDYISSDIKCTLVEPDPNSIKLIREHIKGRPNITLHEVAVYDKVCEIELVKREASTFVSGLESSPSLVNDYSRKFEDEKITVKATTFDNIDDGSIDLLSVDTEGCEWYVIQFLESRPAVISLETHGGMYINPNMSKITNWMDENGYSRFFLTGSDTVYIKNDKISISSEDKLVLLFNDIVIAFRRFRKKLKKAIRAFGK